MPIYCDITIKRHISDMSVDVKESILDKVKASTLFSFQVEVDEVTDVSSCAQLMVFVQYLYAVISMKISCLVVHLKQLKYKSRKHL